MRAIAIQAHGGLDQVKLRTDWPEPSAGPGQAVVDVSACGLNYLDIFVLQGMPGLPVQMPRIPGGDIAGVVRSVGAGVGREWVGRRVLIDPHIKPGGALGEHANGGLCEQIAVDAENLIHMPDAVTFEQAASLPIAYGTAHRMLIARGQLRAGELVLILGASGGVGTGCVILAKHLGAEVIACTSSAEKMQKLAALGADEVINVKEADFSKWAVEKYGKPQRRSYDGGVDVVINFTGGDTWHPSLRCLKRGGRLLVCGATAGYDPKEDLRYIWSFELKVIGSNSFYDDDLQALMKLIAAGKMRPVIDKVLPLGEAREGLRLIQDREVIGKVVVAP